MATRPHTLTDQTQTANVIVSFNSREAEEFLNGLKQGNLEGEAIPATLSEFVSKNKNTFLFNYSSPHNILKFVHSQNYAPGGSGGTAPLIDMEIVDPTYSFEARVMNYGNLKKSSKLFTAPANMADVSAIYSDMWTKYLDNLVTEAVKDRSNLIGSESAGTYTLFDPQTGNAPLDKLLSNFSEIGGMSKFAANSLQTQIIESSKAVQNFEIKVPTVAQMAQKLGIATSSIDTVITNVPALAGIAGKTYGIEDFSEVLNNFTGNQAAKDLLVQTAELKELNKIRPAVLAKLKTQSASELHEIMQSLESETTKGSYPYLYVYYGIGSQFGSWAGPFLCQVAEVDVKSTGKGARTLSIKLIVSNNLLGGDQTGAVMDLGFNRYFSSTHEVSLFDIEKIMNFHLEGGKMRLNYGQTSMQEGWTPPPGKGGGTQEPQYSTQPKNTKRLFYTGEVNDFNTLLLQMIKDYIIKANSPNSLKEGNIIIMLPSLTPALEKKCAVYIKNYLESDSVLRSNWNFERAHTGHNIYLQGDNYIAKRPLPERKDFPDFQSYADAVVKHRDEEGKLTPFKINNHFLSEFNAFKKLCGLLGLSFFRNNAKATKDLGIKKLPFRALNPLLYEVSPYLPAQGSTPDWKAAFQQYFGNGDGSVAFALSLVKESWETYDQTITNFLTTLRNVLNVDITPKMMWENDLELLKIMELHGIIEDSKSPVCIVGDSELIEKFVYGQIAVWEDVAPGTFQSLRKSLTTQDQGIFTSNYITSINSILFTDTVGAYDALFTAKDKGQPLTDLPLETWENANSKKVIHRMPIFKAGVKDSNIISLDFNTKAQYFINLFHNFYHDISKFGNSGKINTSLPAALGPQQGPKGSQKQPTANLLGHGWGSNLPGSLYVGMIDMVREEFGEDIKNTLGIDVDNDTEFSNFVRQMFNLSGGQRGFTYTLDPELDAVPPVMVLNFMKRLQQLFAVGSMTTLPYFKLSSPKVTMRPCFIYVKEPAAPSTDPHLLDPRKYPLKSVVNSFYTGFWRIFGFKHTITGGAVNSQFTVQRDSADMSQFTSPVLEAESPEGLGVLWAEGDPGFSLEDLKETGLDMLETAEAAAVTAGGWIKDQALEGAEYIETLLDEGGKSP